MLAPIIVVLALAADAPDRLSWRDIAPPEGYERPAVARIFDLGRREADRASGIIRDLFPDALKTSVVDGRLVVVGPPRTIEFSTAVLVALIARGAGEEGKEAGAKAPFPAAPEATARLRAAVQDSLGDLRYSRLPPTKIRMVPDGRVPEQSIELRSVALGALIGYIGRVKAACPAAEVVSASFSRARNAKEADLWAANIAFVAVEGLPEAGGARPRGFPESYGDLRSILDASGISANLKAIEYASDRGSLTVSLAVPGIDDQRRLESALVESTSPFQMVQSSANAGKNANEVNVFLELKPREGSRR